MPAILVTDFTSSRVAAQSSNLRYAEAKPDSSGTWTWTVNPVGGGIGFIGTDANRAAAVDAMFAQMLTE